MNHEPLYLFAFGLSYTQFTYSDLKVSSKKNTIKQKHIVSVKVENTGNLRSDEVVQLYLSDLVASVVMSNFQLVAMKRINLIAGESKEVVFELEPKDFELLDNDGMRKIESGDFKIYVGSSSSMSKSFELGAPKMQHTVIKML